MKDNDFEVHPRGTARELKMSRELVAIMCEHRLKNPYGPGMFTKEITTKLDALVEYLTSQVEN